MSTPESTPDDRSNPPSGYRQIATALRVHDDGHWYALIAFPGPLSLVTEYVEHFTAISPEVFGSLAVRQLDVQADRTMIELTGTMQAVVSVLLNYGVWLGTPDDERMPLSAMLAAGQALLNVTQEPGTDD